jgi:hypothetical protein
MTDGRKRILAKFYRTASGAEPVREWLRSLDAPDRRTVGMDLKVVEYGWPVGMPLCRPLDMAFGKSAARFRRGGSRA